MKRNNLVRVRTLGALGALAVAAAGCGNSAAPHSGGAVVKASHAKALKIIPAPANTLGATAPQTNGTLWAVAGNAKSHGIYQMDLSNHKVIGSLSVSNTASTIVESPTGLVALGMATPSTGAVEFRNGSSGSLLATVPLSGPVVALAAGVDGSTFYALNGHPGNMAIDIINSQKGSIETSLPAPSNAVSVVPAPNEQSVYVLQTNGVVSQIATTGGHIATQFPIGHSGRALAIGSGGNTLYVLKGQGSVRNVAVVNIPTESVKTVLPAPSNTKNVALSPNGKELYDVVGAPGIGDIQAFAVP